MARSPVSEDRVWPAPAKLNLFLHVTGRRPDGYHDLQTLFRFVDHGDGLRFRVSTDGRLRRLAGPDDVPEADDLTMRAARLLQQSTGARSGADVWLDKRLPAGGGLGGGSSDAATALIVLNHLWGTGLRRAELQRLGRQVGADVPVFIHGHTAFAEGVGDELESVALPEAWYVVITPPVHVSTAAVFGHPDLTRNSDRIRMATFFSGVTRNDLEAVVCRMAPEVGRALDWLRQHGAARMSGSGSSVFCGFRTRVEAQQVLGQAPPGTRGFVARGLDEHPLRSLTTD